MYDQFLMYLTLTLARPNETGLREINCSVVVTDEYRNLRENDFEVEGGAYDGIFHALIFKIHREQPDPVVDISSLAVRESSSDSDQEEKVSLDYSLSSSNETTSDTSSDSITPRSLKGSITNDL